MNNLAQALGLSATYFLNVHGLDESETQAGAYGSARDIAKLFAYAVQTAPSVFENTSRADIRLSEQNASTAAINTNEALPEIPGVVMGKTGFTDLAGGNLAVLFEAGLSERIVVVVLGSTRQGRFSDVQTLVDATLKAISASAEGVQ
jgi:D-alanyl-D-alanine carboxypeptidase